MLSSPLFDHQIGLRPQSKSGRKPLQPKNEVSNNPTVNNTNLTKIQIPTMKPKQDPSNKENFTTLFPKGKSDVKIINIEPFEASLAEELSSIKKKMERLKLDKDKTEKLLKERDLMLDMQMNQLQIRGEAQMQLEIEVDKLFRLKEMRFSCLKRSPFRSFRDMEEEKKTKEEESQANASLLV